MYKTAFWSIATAAALLACSSAYAKPSLIGMTEGASRLIGFIGFDPGPDDVDYTLVVATKENNLHTTKTIRRHQAWVRIDIVNANRASTQYVHVPTATVVETGANPDDPRRYLAIRRPDNDRASGAAYQNSKTGETQTIAGEQCEVRLVYSHIMDGVTASQRLSCISAEGIELAGWTISRWTSEPYLQATATSISRSPVAASDVEPPRGLLNAASWLATAEPSPKDTDYRVLLQTSDGRSRRLIRSQGGWRSVESRAPSGAHSIQALAADGWVYANFDPQGRPIELSVNRGPRPAELRKVPIKRPDESVLGQNCKWYDVMPDVDDAGQLECRTDEGIVLKIITTNWGSGSAFEAVELDIGPLEGDAVVSPQLFELDRWTSGATFPAADLSGGLRVAPSLEPETLER